MANSKISDLTAVTNVLATDEYVLARSGVSNKITAADLLVADAVEFTPAGTISSTDVQAAIEEVSGDVPTTASELPFVPAGTIAATDVQAAIEEVAAEAGTGGELDYVQITSSVNIASTSQASPTTIVTGSNLTVDGSTVIIVQFQALGMSSPSNAQNDFCILNLHVSTNNGSSYSDIGQIGAVQTPAAGITLAPMHCERRLTPAAGTAKYRIVAWANTTVGTPVVLAGAGGASTATPAFIRVVTA